MAEEKKGPNGVIGWAVGGSIVTGAIGIVGAVISVLGGHVQAAGTFLIASAIAFGLLAGALLRQ